jgi:hypothetical protein
MDHITWYTELVGPLPLGSIAARIGSDRIGSDMGSVLDRKGKDRTVHVVHSERLYWFYPIKYSTVMFVVDKRCIHFPQYCGCTVYIRYCMLFCSTVQLRHVQWWRLFLASYSSSFRIPLYSIRFIQFLRFDSFD